MNLSVIEYNAIMMAIDNAKSSIKEDTFLDPYNTDKDASKYNNTNMLEALNSVEDKLIASSIPF